MSKLIEEIIVLADELDKVGSIKLADELTEIIKEVKKLEDEENKKQKIKCPVCKGEGISETSPFCEICKGTGEVVKEAGLEKTAYVRRRGNKWVVLSRKGKVLYTAKNKADAVKRLRQIEFFKHKG